MRRLTLSSAILGLMTAAALTVSAASAASDDFKGAVEVDARRIHLECEGEGRPAVILISGYRNDAEIWTVDPRGGRTPVFDGVAGFTRVCAYDRPGTILVADHLSRSDPALMPRTADAIVAELHGVLEASRTAPPYVLAAHSLGGLFARLYAATYPGDVAGLALVDAWQKDLPSILGPAQWSAYVDLATPPPPGLEAYRDLESVDFAAASARMREAARTVSLRPMPLVVISRAKPVQLPPNVTPALSADAFGAAWREGQARLAALLPDARHAIATESDHYVQVEQPDLVVEAIRTVVEAACNPAACRR